MVWLRLDASPFDFLVKFSWKGELLWIPLIWEDAHAQSVEKILRCHVGGHLAMMIQWTIGIAGRLKMLNPLSIPSCWIVHKHSR